MLDLDVALIVLLGGLARLRRRPELLELLQLVASHRDAVRTARSRRRLCLETKRRRLELAHLRVAFHLDATAAVADVLDALRAFVGPLLLPLPPLPAFRCPALVSADWMSKILDDLACENKNQC